MKKIVFAFLLLFFCVNMTFAQTDSLKIINNAQLKKLIKENRGKVILLNFFATWCPPCKVEIPELAGIREKYGDSQLLVIGLAVDDDTAEVLPFIEKNGVNYPVYKADKSITDNFGISSVPHNSFFAKDGQMVISEPGMAESELLQQVIDDLLERK